MQHTQEAEEITMDVFLEVYNSAEKFKGEAQIGTWIYRITVNKCLDKIKYLKRKKRITHSNTEDSQELQLPDFEHPGILLEKKEKSRILFGAISLLPENQKNAFLLAQVEQFSNPEVAEILQTTVGAVESLLHRAKQNLRKLLEKYLNA